MIFVQIIPVREASYLWKKQFNLPGIVVTCRYIPWSTAGMLRVVKQLVKIPVFVMIRPRGGDFHYSDQEMDVMKIDVKILKENGADGIVLGLLHRQVTT
jgi:CutC family